jgi:hypothetical protein
MPTVSHLTQQLIDLARSLGSEPQTAPATSTAEASRLKVSYPTGAIDQYLQLLSISNGLSALGLNICSSREQYGHGDDLLAFQNWGNGDFDCLLLTGPDAGSIWFTNHNPDDRARIADSFVTWLAAAIDEATLRRTVWHPSDHIGKGTTGLYSPVIAALRGRDCELARWITPGH